MEMIVTIYSTVMMASMTMMTTVMTGAMWVVVSNDFAIGQDVLVPVGVSTAVCYSFFNFLD
tara:strand:+ start:2566 stop:2748 length:183 start_codon:yes stop_codon:yes gene_type:complete